MLMEEIATLRRQNIRLQVGQENLRACVDAEHELRTYYQGIAEQVWLILNRDEAEDLNDMLDEIEFWVQPSEYIGGYHA